MARTPNKQYGNVSPARREAAVALSLSSLQSRIATLEQFVKPVPHGITVPSQVGTAPAAQQLVIGGKTTIFAPVKFDVGAPPDTLNGTKKAIIFGAVRVTTGSILASATTNVTVNWSSAFADASYTIAVAVLEATGNLTVVDIISSIAASFVVAIKNNDGASAHTGTIHAIGIHD